MTTQNELTAKLFSSFEECCFQQDSQDAWRARDIMGGLGYAQWRRFRDALARAYQSCEATGDDPSLHFRIGDGSSAWTPGEVFADAGKNPKGGRPSEDVILTRRAAYLVAMNGDPRKTEVAFAQHYFALATRSLEILRQRMQEASRIKARRDLSATESRFQGVLFENGVDGKGIAIIRSQGDQILFAGNSTEDMKRKWSVPRSRPLSDFAPEVVIKAKELGTAMTTHNVKVHKLQGQSEISSEHQANNATIRGGLGSRGIFPERLDAEEDIKKVERRHQAAVRQLSKPKKGSRSSIAKR